MIYTVKSGKSLGSDRGKIIAKYANQYRLTLRQRSVSSDIKTEIGIVWH